MKAELVARVRGYLEEHAQGKDQARKARTIADALGIRCRGDRSCRPVREAVHAAVMEYGATIVSGPTGYYCPATRAELTEGIRALEQHIWPTMRRLEELRRRRNEWNPNTLFTIASGVERCRADTEWRLRKMEERKTRTSAPTRGVARSIPRGGGGKLKPLVVIGPGGA